MKEWRTWLEGLIGAAIGGAASAITVMITDPMNYNLQGGLSKLGTVAAVNAIVGAALYLKQRPVPK